jgi:hypothetical protein
MTPAPKRCAVQFDGRAVVVVQPCAAVYQQPPAVPRPHLGSGGRRSRMLYT